MKKTKAQNVDLLYISDKKGKENKAKKVAENQKTATKKNKKMGQVSEKSQTFSFDDEIVIGITKKEEPKKENTKKEDKKKNKAKNKKKDRAALKSKKEKTKKDKKNTTIVKYTVLTIILLGGVIAFFLSPVFEIKNITVINNSKLSSQEIISLSGISVAQNMFRISTGNAERKIKENAYVESVRVTRKLPSDIVIDVNERTVTFMLEYVNGLVYINNQGYTLEVAEDKIAVPILTGIETPVDEFKSGNRLCKEDLLKLETVLKIMETANSYELSSLITKINIADKNDIILYLENEKKTVYLGNASNINIRIMYLKEIIEKEKGIESEIFIRGDINKENVYTREKV